MLRELLGVFGADCSRLVAELRTTLDRGDAEQVRTAAHTLKGMVSFFAATAATEHSKLAAADGAKSKPQTRNQLAESRVATERIESRVEFEKCRKRLPFV